MIRLWWSRVRVCLSILSKKVLRSSHQKDQSSQTNMVTSSYSSRSNSLTSSTLKILKCWGKLYSIWIIRYRRMPIRTPISNAIHCSDLKIVREIRTCKVAMKATRRTAATITTWWTCWNKIAIRNECALSSFKCS